MSKRPKGLKYKIVKFNPTWFKKGSSGFVGKHSQKTKEHLSKIRKGRPKKGGFSFGKGKDNPRWSNALPQTLGKREVLAGRKRPEQCEICGAFGKDFKKGLCFDHDHATNKFRGWICIRCNFAIGLAKDNSELLIAMANYIKKCGI